MEKADNTWTHWSNMLLKWNNAICSNVDGPGDYHIEWSNETEKCHMTWLICGILKKNDTNEPIYKTETDSQT